MPHLMKLKLTQKRSLIGRPKRQKRTIEALGLSGIGTSRTHEDSPSLRGMLEKVKHLVEVEEQSA